MYKAVVSDLDGTLLDDNHELTEKTIEVVNRFVDKGYKFYIATGRLYKGAKYIMDKLGIETYIVCMNGARITDAHGNELYSKKLDKPSNEFLVNFDYEKYGSEIFINGYIGDDWYVQDKKYLDYYSTERKDKPYEPDIITKEEFKKREYNKIFFVGNHENLLKIEKELKKQNLNMNISFVSEKCLEMYHKECNKFNASKFLIDRDNISVDEVVTFGDGINDYEMLIGYKKSYIMNNAIYILKDMVKSFNHIELIENSETNSVARKIEEIFKIGE